MEFVRPDATPGQKARAWAVHAFSASGVVLALLALLAVERGDWVIALLWLFAAMIVDGIDGSFARAAKVSMVLPKINGEALDLIIDYLTYVFIPALFLWRAGLLPVGLELVLVSAILISSLYVFVRRDMKTADGYFRGFPALWNLIALYLFVIDPGPGPAAIIIVLMVVLTFAPVHVVHPFRVRDYGRWLLALSAVWTLTTAALLLPLADPSRLAMTIVSAGSATLLIFLGLLRTVRGARLDQ